MNPIIESEFRNLNRIYTLIMDSLDDLDVIDYDMTWDEWQKLYDFLAYWHHKDKDHKDFYLKFDDMYILAMELLEGIQEHKKIKIWQRNKKKYTNRWTKMIGLTK